MRHRTLPPPSPSTVAVPVARPLFHPRHGWFRRLERTTSLALARHVFPHLPGLPSIYTRQLDRQLVLSRAEIPVPGLGPGLDGARLLLLTDLHAGPFLRPAGVRRLVEALRSVDPDLVLHGGDLATSRVDEVGPSLEALAALRGRLGTFGVLGNHDHYVHDTAALARAIEEAGIVLLTNRSVEVERGGTRLRLAGVDDLLVGRPDLDAALESLPLDGGAMPTVLLSHNPDVFFEAARRGVALVLAGHTHGGQIRLPGLPVLVRQSRFRLDDGRYAAPMGARRGLVLSSQLVVARGLGTTGVPLRLGCPPEAVLVVLRGSPP